MKDRGSFSWKSPEFPHFHLLFFLSKLDFSAGVFPIFGTKVCGLKLFWALKGWQLIIWCCKLTSVIWDWMQKLHNFPVFVCLSLFVNVMVLLWVGLSELALYFYRFSENVNTWFIWITIFKEPIIFYYYAEFTKLGIEPSSYTLWY